MTDKDHKEIAASLRVFSQTIARVADDIDAGKLVLEKGAIEVDFDNGAIHTKGGIAQLPGPDGIHIKMLSDMKFIKSTSG